MDDRYLDPASDFAEAGRDRHLPPDLLDHLEQVVPFIRSSRLGLIVDFDGTISELAPTPAQATPTAGCLEALGCLSGLLALTSVASGRTARDLQEKVGLKGLVYAGNHGAEYLIDGKIEMETGTEPYRSLLGLVMDHLKKAVDGTGLIWEHKGLSVSVHYRLSPDTTRARRNLDSALETAPNVRELEIFWGKQVLEIRAPLGFDKGFAVRKLVQQYGLDAVVFVGDDTTDVDGLVAVKELVSEGKASGLGVAVIDVDTPGPVLAAADFSVAGVPGVEEFLKWLCSEARMRS